GMTPKRGTRFPIFGSHKSPNTPPIWPSKTQSTSEKCSSLSNTGGTRRSQSRENNNLHLLHHLLRHLAACGAYLRADGCRRKRNPGFMGAYSSHCRVCLLGAGEHRDASREGAKAMTYAAMKL